MIFYLAVEPRRGRLDVHVLDAAVEDVPVEGGLELGTVVGLDHLDPEGQLFEHVVDELDGGLLVEVVVDAEHTEPRAVIDRGELVVLPARAPDRRYELHVDLDPMPGLRLLVALPAVLVALVALRRWQAAHVEALEDPPDPRGADLDLVIPLEVHRDLVRPEVVVLAQVNDLADDLLPSGSRAQVRP